VESLDIGSSLSSLVSAQVAGRVACPLERRRCSCRRRQGTHPPVDKPLKHVESEEGVVGSFRADSECVIELAGEVSSPLMRVLGHSIKVGPRRGVTRIDFSAFPQLFRQIASVF
jgi:hypothetical protein